MRCTLVPTSQAPNPRLTGDADRSDLDHFYDSITPKEKGRRQGVLKEEERDEKLAMEQHEAAQKAKDREAAKMLKEHRRNEEAAVKDHERYKKESAAQIALQDAGHDMQVCLRQGLCVLPACTERLRCKVLSMLTTRQPSALLPLCRDENERPTRELLCK